MAFPKKTAPKKGAAPAGKKLPPWLMGKEEKGSPPKGKKGCKK